MEIEQWIVRRKKSTFEELCGVVINVLSVAPQLLVVRGTDDGCKFCCSFPPEYAILFCAWPIQWKHTDETTRIYRILAHVGIFRVLLKSAFQQNKKLAMFQK